MGKILHVLVIWTIGLVCATEWDSLVDQNYPKTCSRNNLFGDSRNGQSSVNLPPLVTQVDAFVYVQRGQRLAKAMEVTEAAASAPGEGFPSLAMRHFFSSQLSPDTRSQAAASKANLLGARIMQNKKSSCGRMTPNTFTAFLQSRAFRGAPGRRLPLCAGAGGHRGATGAPLDGACNNLARPHWGAASQAFTRIADHNYADGLYSMPVAKSGRPLPSPRLLSSTLMVGPPTSSATISAMAVYWGQVITHDMSMRVMEQHGSGGGIQCCSTDGTSKLWGNKLHSACAPIDISPYDLFYSKYGVRYLNFVRSLTSPNGQNTLGPAEQLNAVSSFIDCSPVYGFNEALASQLREHQGGLLRLTGTGQLPQTPDSSKICDTSQGRCPCFMTGDPRSNQTPGLAALQTVLAREHNRLARALGALNPHWEDERLYQEARRLLIAQVQHITYHEWLPLLMGKSYTQQFSISPTGFFSFDYNENINAGVINSFAAGAFRSFHTMVPGDVAIIPEGSQQPFEIKLSDQYLRPCILQHFPSAVEGVVRGAVTQPAMAHDTSFTPELSNLLFKARGSWGLDLVAFDIQRGRDHGLASYNTYRSICGLNRANDFEDLAQEISQERITALRQVYESVDDIDLFVGGMLESGVHGSVLGPTFQSIVGEQFFRTRVGDRFFYSVGDMAHSFTADQLREIKKASIARLISDNCNIQTLQKRAFELPLHTNPPYNSQDTQNIPSINLQYWKEY